MSSNDTLAETDACRFFSKPKIRLMIHQRIAYLSSILGCVSGEKFLTGGLGGGKKRMRIHATGGAYLNSRLTFIYLATFNFYGRDSADSLGPAGSSRCVVPGTPGAPGAWYNIRGRAAPLNWGVPRVAIRRTRASKTRRKSYLWSKGKRRR